MTDTTEGTGIRRLAWFVALWAGGVLAVAGVAWLLRGAFSALVALV